MELALICAQQVIVLFLLIGAGAAAIKTGVLKPEGRQTLSNLLVYLVVPAMIVHSYMMDFSEEILHNLLAAFGLSVLAILIGTVLTLALTARQKDRRAPIFRFASVFSNAAYMGFPLISALFGSERISLPSSFFILKRHDRRHSPSMSTLQLPHWPRSQPHFAPVRPSTSRR